MPAEPTDLGAIRLGDVVRASIWVIVACSLVGLLLGIGAVTRIDPVSTATTPILLNPLDGNPFDPSSRGGQLVNLESEAQAVRSTAVAGLVRTELGTDATEAELLSNVDVEVPVNTQILEISYTSPDAATATTYSQAFADAYLQHRTNRAQERIDEQTALLEEQITTSTARLEELAGELATVPSTSARASVIEQEIDTLAGQVTTLGARQAELSTTPVDPGQLVTPAALESSGPLTLETVLPLVGLVLGALVGLLIGTLRSRADLRLRTPQDVLDLGVPVLGTIAWVDPSEDSGKADPEQIDDEYRKIRVAILALERRRPFTLLVGSASTSSTGPTSVVDLCTSFARAGLDTVVIDATSNGDGPASVLDPTSEAGLTEVLLGDEVLTQALAPIAPLLWVLGPGGDIGSVVDLFVGDPMARLLDAAKDHCDVVIVATDSLQQGVAQSLADIADAVVVETDADVTTRPELERVARAVKLLGDSFLGSIFVGRDAAARARLFQPHFTVNQRQLPAGPFASLGGVQETPDDADDAADDLDAGDARPTERGGPDADRTELRDRDDETPARKRRGSPGGNERNGKDREPSSTRRSSARADAGARVGDDPDGNDSDLADDRAQGGQ